MSVENSELRPGNLVLRRIKRPTRRPSDETYQRRRSIRKFDKKEARSIFAMLLLASTLRAFSQFKKPPDSPVTLVSEAISDQPTEEEIYEANWSIFPSTITYWRDNIQRWSQEYGIDPIFIATVILIESGGNPYALSASGAEGLFQVMRIYHVPAGVAANLFDAGVNAQYALGYLKLCLERAGGQRELAAAYYNAGISGVDGPSGLSEQTESYIRWIYIGDTNSPIEQRKKRLTDWISAGGNSLLEQAAQNLGIELVIPD